MDDYFTWARENLDNHIENSENTIEELKPLNKLVEEIFEDKFFVESLNCTKEEAITTIQNDIKEI